PRNPSKLLRGKKTKVKKPRQKFRMADIKVGTLLLWVLALFMMLMIALGGLGGFFLWQNMETIRQLEQQDHRSQLASRIGTDMLRARISLLTAARYEQEAVESGRNAYREQAREAVSQATQSLDAVRDTFTAFRETMSDMG